MGTNRQRVGLFPSTLDVKDLGAGERRELAERLFHIYDETVTGREPEDLEADLFASEDTRIALFHGPDGTLAGFSYARIERVSAGARTHAVFSAGVYFRLAYRGGAPAGLFGLTEAVRFKLRHPFTPLGYLTRCSSPAVYRLLATAPRIHPNRRHDTPEEIDALIRALCARRGYEIVGERPLRAQSVSIPRAAGRLGRVSEDPDARFFLRHVPDYADGRALLVFMPLDLANVAGALARLALHRRRRPGSTRAHPRADRAAPPAPDAAITPARWDDGSENAGPAEAARPTKASASAGHSR